MDYHPFLLAASSAISSIGQYAIFCLETIKRLFSKQISLRLVLSQMELVGVQSFWVIILASIMIGGVFGIQFGNIFRLFGAESMIGAAASFALSKELAPVVTAFLVTGRSGSAMAAEIATMKVNEQLDAMRIMAVHPVAYLVCPRVLGSILVMPLLTGFFLLCGICSAFVMGVLLFDIDKGIFIDKIQWISRPKHIVQGLEKAMVFGFIFSTIGCFKGFYAKGGAKGVGIATTDAVVTSLVMILISDYFISYLQL